MSDTIAAVATGAGVSAIGIVRVSGPHSVSLMDALFRPTDGKAMSQHRDRQLVYGKLLDEKGRTLDLCLCTLSRAPRKLFIPLNSQTASIRLVFPWAFSP